MKNKSIIMSLSAILTAASIVISVPSQALDWNGRTALAIIERIDGKFNLKSGHPLATANAFRYLKAAARSNPKLRRIIIETLGREEDPNKAIFGSKQSMALQTVLFGGWMNEINVNIDGFDSGSSAHVHAPEEDDQLEHLHEVKFFDPMRLAGAVMRYFYKPWLANYQNSIRYALSTKYSSSNFMHSMEVTSTATDALIGQGGTYRLVEEYIWHSIVSSVTNLGIAAKGAADGKLTPDQILEARKIALMQLGSVFHLIEDSTVSCTEGAKKYVPECIPGDGHSIIKNLNGRPQVVTMADNSFYLIRHDMHSQLDDNYRPERIKEVFTVDGVNLDPARINAGILREVLHGAWIIKQFLGHRKISSKKMKNSFERDQARMVEATLKHTRLDNWMLKIGNAKAKMVDDKFVSLHFAKAEDREPMPALPAQ